MEDTDDSSIGKNYIIDCST